MITKELQIQETDGLWKLKIKELSWEESLQIDYLSYEEYGTGYTYSGERDLRETVFQCVETIIDPKGNNVDQSLIKGAWVEQIYNFYHFNFTLSAEEAASVYEQAKFYFKGQSQNRPLDPYIVKVDYMLKGILSFSNTEFSQLSNRELEKIQLIISAQNSVNAPQEPDTKSLEEQAEALGFSL